MDDIVKSFIEVKLNDPENFLKICESLTRIGVVSNKEKKLFQTCHVLHKQGKYYIVHFKELLALDGLDVDISEEDVQRRNMIVDLLQQWNLVTVLKPDLIKEKSMSNLKVVPFKDKSQYQLIYKYKIGRK